MRFGGVLRVASESAELNVPLASWLNRKPDIEVQRWYAVHTRPHRELGAARQLTFQGFASFLPLHWKTVRHARQFRTTKAAFFPRYLFVRLNLARDRWRAVSGTYGVSAMVMEGDRPKPVPTGIVEDLYALADEEGVLTFDRILQPGQRVRMLSGPFAEKIGELKGLADRDRVQVLLDVMGARITVQTNAGMLAPV